MNRRPLSKEFLAAAAVLTLAGCAMFDANEPMVRKSAPPADAQAEKTSGEREKVYLESTTTEDESGRTGTGSETAGARVTRKKTRIEFDDRAIEGELNKPDGEYVESRKKTKFNSLIKVPDPLGNERVPVAAPTPTPRAREEVDDFDQSFDGDDGKKRHAGYISPAADPKPVTPPAKPDPSDPVARERAKREAKDVHLRADTTDEKAADKQLRVEDSINARLAMKSPAQPGPRAKEGEKAGTFAAPVGNTANGKVETEPPPPAVVVMKPPEEKKPEVSESPSLQSAPKEPPSNPADYLRHYGVNPTIETSDERFSTFAADVDTGSYTIARSYLERGQLPPEAAVRVEEVVNSFDYAYRAPEKEAFAVQVEAFPSPNRKGYHVLHLGLKGREVSASARKPASLVFTIDVSGSMSGENRLGLVKRSLDLLLRELDERDQVSIVVYGDAARVALPPTNASDKERIGAAIHQLRSEGSTNVQAGLELAYNMALKAFKPQGVNRVILLSDGVANNGITNADGIFAKVKARASEGITLTTVGFGMGDYNDVLMERLADQGDGQYAYVDKLDEARRIFVEQLTGTLQVIAKDVKLQLEFNPEAVARYRLLGFENRALTKQDFHDDKKDAGELGAGHSVTAVYELKFKSREPKTFATFRARFKEPRGVTSGLVQKELPMSLVSDSLSASTGPARLSLVAAGFAEKLRGSYWARNLRWGELVELWDTLPEGLKSKPRVQELRALMLKAKSLDRRPDRFEPSMPVASMDFDRVPVLR